MEPAAGCRPELDEATALLKAEHPGQAALIDAFHQRWPEMMAGEVAGTVAILRELKQAGTPLYALTNWSQETFPLARERFPFLNWFDGIVVSGQEKLVKPDPQIYRVLVERHGLRPEDIAYIDDNPRNAAAATALGMHGIHFIGPVAFTAGAGCPWVACLTLVSSSCPDGGRLYGPQKAWTAAGTWIATPSSGGSQRQPRTCDAPNIAGSAAALTRRD